MYHALEGGSNSKPAGGYNYCQMSDDGFCLKCKAPPALIEHEWDGQGKKHKFRDCHRYFVYQLEGRWGGVDYGPHFFHNGYASGSSSFWTMQAWSRFFAHYPNYWMLDDGTFRIDCSQLF